MWPGRLPLESLPLNLRGPGGAAPWTTVVGTGQEIVTDESPGGSRVRGGDRSHNTGPALESHLRFLAWLIPAVERFPRSQKFLLGDRIQTSALDVLERLIEATYIKRRGDALASANLGIKKLRFLFRLAHGCSIWTTADTNMQRGPSTRPGA